MTVVHRIRERVERFGDRPAIIEGPLTESHGELYERVDRLSQGLLALGVRKGDRVLAVLPNVHEAIECELACFQSGIVWITLTARLTWAEIEGVVALCRPRVFVTDADGIEKVRLGLAATPLEPAPTFVLTGQRAPSGSGALDAPLGYEDLIRSSPARRPESPVDDEDPARLRYTSGTTGSAKAAVLPHRVYEALLRNLLHELPPASERDRTLHVAPLTHGSGALVYPTLWGGGANILVSRFDVEEVLATVERESVTTFFTVPTILSRLLLSPSFAQRNLSSLRSLIYGGAPMPEAQLAVAVSNIGEALMQIYGMTEAPWPITALKPSDHRVGGPKLRSVGRPTPGCSLSITDETGKELGTGEVGEIQIAGRNVMQGYYLDPEATAEVLRDGWLASGDLGYLDHDGYLFIVGRKKDVIISGGFNVYATEVEAALCSDDRVLEAAVVGMPHPDLGEMVVACVVPKEGVSLSSEHVDAVARKLLSGYKCPRRIEVVAELPKNPSGKIQKRELLARLSIDESGVRE